MKRIRRYIVAGLLVWVPLGVTLFLLKVLVDLMDQTLLLLPPPYRPDALLGFHIPGLGILLSLAVLLVTGILAANLVGRQLVHLWESILQRIPFVRSIYSAAKNFAEIVLTDANQSFNKVLLIEYPRKGLYSLCFQTSTYLGEVQARTGEDVICVFVPTTPNPTSGLILMVPKSDVIELEMDVEDALKMVVSLGVVVPRWNGEDAPVSLAKAQPQP
ncbi:MAG: DUF502 domain-containing protein [Gammaproteobacteria bacterium]|jgi:uncharacterized membrane protein|nr:DUF502 domain-containing protein [Gammaproteobacteria bacterium]